jgi:phosphatidate cytidylyltransferase
MTHYAILPGASVDTVDWKSKKAQHDLRPPRNSPSMIGTRILVGSLLALAAVGVLIGDGYLGPWFPCLFVCLMAAGVLAARELVHIFPEAYRPSRSLVTAAIFICLAGNWYPTAQREIGYGVGSVWSFLVFAFVATLIVSFLLEMHHYHQPGGVVPRLGATVLAVAYLGLLPCFFVQIRFINSNYTGLLLALAILVPKCNDVAAFFTGTFVGRTKMTPLLSPKKTWEGFAGGMIGGTVVAVIVSFAVPVFPGGVAEAVVFGLAMGLAGVLGDLAESLIKRDCQTKDASKDIPGFGGLLDVIDSVLFAAPIAFLWFTLPRA